MMKLERDTHWYRTHLNRLPCCGVEPDLCTETSSRTFILEAAYWCVCPECGRAGPSGITTDGASASWNALIKQASSIEAGARSRNPILTKGD